MAAWAPGGNWTAPMPSGVSSASSTGWQTELSLSSVGSRGRRASYAPSQRELRKYASLFLRTDTDQDGYIQGEEARSLGSLSSLESSQLAAAWNLADQDCDGRLTFDEFVVFVHLITCCTRGLAIPDPAGGRPHELQASVASLDTPANLHSQRSRSPSRAGSSAPPSSRATSPGPPYMDTNAADPWEQSFQQAETAKSESKVRPSCAPVAIDTSEDALTSDRHPEGIPPEPMSSPCFGGDLTEYGAAPQADIDMIRTHLGGTVQADCVVAQRVQFSCRELEAHLATEEAVRTKLRTQVARAADDDRRLRDMAAELERQVTDARERLRQAHDDRRHLHSGQWAQLRSNDTCSFLQEQLEEEGRLLEEMQNSNKLLQESCRSLEKELKGFSAARVEVLKEIEQEQEQVEQLRAKSVGRSQADLFGSSSRGAASPSSQGLFPPPSGTIGGPRWDTGRAEPFGWATSLVGPSSTSPNLAQAASPVRSQAGAGIPTNVGYPVPASRRMGV